MKFTTRKIATASVLLGLIALTPVVTLAHETPPPSSHTTPSTPAKNGKEGHPAIRKAIKEIEAARKHLEEAGHDFGGHKVEAMKACDEAITQLKEAEKFDKK